MTVSFQEKLLGTSLQYQLERFLQAQFHTPVALQDTGYEPLCPVGPHRGSVKPRFIPAPSKASLSIYTKGLD